MLIQDEPNKDLLEYKPSIDCKLKLLDKDLNDIMSDYINGLIVNKKQLSYINTAKIIPIESFYIIYIIKSVCTQLVNINYSKNVFIIFSILIKYFTLITIFFKIIKVKFNFAALSDFRF